MASYKKLKTGWQFRISYKDIDGKYRIKSRNGFRTKGEAQVEAEKLEKLLREGYVLDNDETFGDYMQDWYETFKKDVHSINNNADIELSIKWVKKYFKKTLLKNVTRAKYQNFLNWYGTGRSTATVRKIHVYASGCLEDAFNQGHIHRNPVWKISAKGTESAKKDEDKFLNYKDTQLLTEEMKRNLKPSWHSRYMILIALATGMRFSEILALNWSDIDLEKETIEVNKSFDYRIEKKFSTTKTVSSVRTIPINPATVELLRKFKLGNDLKYKNHLFIEETDDGYNHVSNSAVNKALRKACERLDIKKVSFHSLRHTHCSLLIYKNINIKYISQRLGHSSTDITYRIYGHIIEELEKKETDKVKELLDELSNAK